MVRKSKTNRVRHRHLLMQSPLCKSYSTFSCLWNIRRIHSSCLSAARADPAKMIPVSFLFLAFRSSKSPDTRAGIPVNAETENEKFRKKTCSAPVQAINISRCGSTRWRRCLGFECMHKMYRRPKSCFFLAALVVLSDNGAAPNRGLTVVSSSVHLKPRAPPPSSSPSFAAINLNKEKINYRQTRKPKH